MQPLHRTQDRIQEGAFALVDSRHERAQRLGQQKQDHEIENELKPAVEIHPNHSGFKSASTR